MERLAVLERTTEKNGKTSEENREISAQEQLHRDKMPEYRKALYSDATDVLEAETVKPVKESAPAVRTAPSAAHKFADYTPYAPPASKKVLFEDVTTKDFAPAAAATVQTAPVAAPVYAPQPAVKPAEASVLTEEDALPTPRTMNTLRHSTVEETETLTRTGFFAALSTRTKVVLAAIAFAIVLAVVVICINTGIINAKDANIQALREQVRQKQQEYEQIINQIEDIENFEGSIVDLVTDYAEEHGMIRK